MALYFSVRSTLVVVPTTAPRDVPSGHVQNQKTFLIFCVPPPTPSRLNKQRKGFLVLVRRFVFQKASFKLHLLESFHFAFFRLHADPRRSATRAHRSFVPREPPNRLRIAHSLRSCGCCGGWVDRS